MAEIDPRIALAVRLPEPVAYDPVGAMARNLQVQRAIQGNQHSALELSQLQQQLAESQAMRDVLGRHAQTIGSAGGDQAYLRDLAQTSPGAYLATRQQFGKEDVSKATAAANLMRGQAAVGKVSLEGIHQAMGQLAGIWSQVRDEASFQRALEISRPIYNQAAGAEAERLPLEAAVGTSYDPQRGAQATARWQSGPERVSAIVDARERESMQQQMQRHGAEMGMREQELRQRGAQHSDTMAMRGVELQGRLGESAANRAVQREQIASTEALGQQRLQETREQHAAARAENTRKTLLEVNQKRLTQITDRAQTAQNVDGLLDQIDALRAQGVYDRSFLTPALLAAWEKGGVLPPGADAATMARTVELRNLGSNVLKNQVANIAAQGFSNADRELVNRAIGGLTELLPAAQLDLTLKNLRTLNARTRKQADIATQHFNQTGGMLPSFDKVSQIKALLDAAKAEGVKMTPKEAEEYLREQRLIE